MSPDSRPAGSHPLWHPIVREQYSSPVPHQPWEEQQRPLPQVVSLMCSVL